MDRIVHISDWHTVGPLADRRLEHECLDVPNDPDLVIITGDMIADASEKISINKLLAPQYQPFHYEQLIDAIERKWEGVDIVAVRGNHDWFDYELDGRVIELGNKRLHWEWRKHWITGIRGFLGDNGCWNDEQSESGFERIAQVVDWGTTILLTHQPPYGIYDDVRDSPKNWKDYECHPGPRRIGSKAILRLTRQLHFLEAHCFGHVHEQGGMSHVNRGCRYSNAACTLNYFELG